MANKVPDRVCQTITDMESPFVPSGSVQGFRTFAQALVDGDLLSGDSVQICLTDGTSFEVHQCTYNPSTGLTSSGIISSSNGGSAVSSWLSGRKLIFATASQTIMSSLGLLPDLTGIVDGDFIVGTGPGTIGLESGNTARTSLGLGTGDTPVFTGLKISGQSIFGSGSLTPDGTLHVHTASAGSVTAQVNADDLIIENSTTAGLSILVPNTSDCRIHLGDTDDNDVCRIGYNHSSNFFFVDVNAAEALRIDSNRRALFGTSNGLLSSQLSIGGNGNVTAGIDGTGNIGAFNLIDTGSGNYTHITRRGTDHATEADDTILFDFVSPGTFNEIFRYDKSVPKFLITPATHHVGNVGIGVVHDSNIPLTVVESVSNTTALIQNTLATSTAVHPLLDMFRNGGAASAGHSAGGVQFSSTDDAGNFQAYASVAGFVASPTNGAEFGNLDLRVAVSGVLTSRVRMTSSWQVSMGDFKCGDQAAVNDTPGAALHVADSISNGTIALFQGTANSANPIVVAIDRTRTGVTSDILGDFSFTGRDAGGNSHSFVRLRGVIGDATDTTEDGILRVLAIVNGTESTQFEVATGVAVRLAGVAPTSGIIAGGVNAHGQYEQGRKIGGVVSSKFSNTGNVGAGADTLESIAVPAALLFNNGDAIRYYAAGSLAATANTKSLVLAFAGTTILAPGALAINGDAFVIEALIIKDGTDSWRASASFRTGDALALSFTQVTGSTAVDLDVSQNLVLTGESGGAATDDIILTQSKLNFNPA